MTSLFTIGDYNMQIRLDAATNFAACVPMEPFVATAMVTMIHMRAIPIVQVGYITRFGLGVIYTASDLWPLVCRSHRDLHLVL